MSEFMKNVVEEVLKPYQKPKENPLNKRGDQRPPKPAVTVSTDKRKQEIPGIKRPNYQRDRIKKRLSVGKAEKVNSNYTTPGDTRPTGKTFEKPEVSREFVEGPLAALQTMSLVQGSSTTRGHQRQVPRYLSSNESSQFIGRSRDGVKAWLFSEIHPQLEGAFQRAAQTCSVGVITSSECTVGQLFLVNEVMREYASLKYYLTWDKDNQGGFLLELYDQDRERLLKVTKGLFQKLSQNSYKTLKLHNALSPSPWLTKQLDLKTPVNGIAVIEGVDYYTSVLLMDRLFKRTGEKNFGYKIEKHYLVLHGNYDLVIKVSDELQKDADRVR
ncbi:hypothetical protein [Pseudalkalibacillus caeni]|uniref:Uncharacterized protein n=1 Tax=Exobacillus caeni TaxID=2574798 RepID=A0A5R9F8U1_9BACL|nr:hypothetical protein [Pseudalkalibacillus caeni]TLS38939.1 hypothetical protein FCL54_01105 [Pseudalkalibacillus caeni]